MRIVWASIILHTCLVVVAACWYVARVYAYRREQRARIETDTDDNTTFTIIYNDENGGPTASHASGSADSITTDEANHLRVPRGMTGQQPFADLHHQSSVESRESFGEIDARTSIVEHASPIAGSHLPSHHSNGNGDNFGTRNLTSPHAGGHSLGSPLERVRNRGTATTFFNTDHGNDSFRQQHPLRRPQATYSQNIGQVQRAEQHRSPKYADPLTLAILESDPESFDTSTHVQDTYNRQRSEQQAAEQRTETLHNAQEAAHRALQQQIDEALSVPYPEMPQTPIQYLTIQCVAARQVEPQHAGQQMEGSFASIDENEHNLNGHGHDHQSPSHPQHGFNASPSLSRAPRAVLSPISDTTWPSDPNGGGRARAVRKMPSQLGTMLTARNSPAGFGGAASDEPYTVQPVRSHSRDGFF